MANSLVVRKGTSPAQLIRAGRAAQYVRMSTDLQRYSIQNQAAAIAANALDKNLTIVRTYRDEGRSGLRIKGRPGPDRAHRRCRIGTHRLRLCSRIRRQPMGALPRRRRKRTP
ncbi:MAG TPA: recombinase family protein [Bradyrhizobium sp.]